MKLKKTVAWLMNRVQRSLFPHLEECCGRELTEQERQVVRILDVARIEEHLPYGMKPVGVGRKPKERAAIARALVVKASCRYKTTEDLVKALRTTPVLRRICGFERQADVPSAATFSRVFRMLAEAGFGEKVHAQMVGIYAGGLLVGHISRDSTAIEGREKPVRRGKPVRVARKRGRPRKGEIRIPEPTRLERQRTQTVEEMVGELPVACDIGIKRNAQGFQTKWKGYKLHLDVTDGGLPVNALLTSASVHDSQVAIPLMRTTSKRVTYLYDLMDAAYDAEVIRDESRSLAHVPIIDRNKRRGTRAPMAPHERARYKERSVAERCNSTLKENFGGRDVMVRGHRKVMLHLMLGVIALFADQLIRLCG